MSKTLVLLRHGHRDTTNRELDNGLNEKGREQAKAIKRYFSERFADYDPSKGLWFVSSPKLRCLETLQPTAKSLNREVDANPALDEQAIKESGAMMERRIQGFFEEWQRSNIGLTMLCSHGDWLPLAVLRLLKIGVNPKKASWMEIEWDAGYSLLKSYIPSFKTFYK